MKKIITILIFKFILVSVNAQLIQVINTEKKESFRGLSVVNENVIWVSGTNGTIGKSIDGGISFNWFEVKGFEKTDFRDIEAFNENTAIIMGIAEPAIILKTTDGGKNWKLVFKNEQKGMFLDAMEFWNEQSGIVIGDPIKDKLFIARTFDGGNTWNILPQQYMPSAETGEACFASSGTNIRVLNKQEAVFITGGLKSKMYIRDQKINLPILQGKETTGANSIAVKNKKTMIIVGGDFLQKDSSFKNCVITNDGGKTFTTPTIAPHGYRSCVEYLEKDNWVCCGLNGVDYTTNNGNIWKLISSESFNVCKTSKKGKAVFFAGNGKIAKLTFTKL